MQPACRQLQPVQEVTLLRTLRHRNVVQFYGACLEPDCFFIVTELMQGACSTFLAALQARACARLTAASPARPQVHGAAAKAVQLTGLSACADCWGPLVAAQRGLAQPRCTVLSCVRPVRATVPEAPGAAAPAELPRQQAWAPAGDPGAATLTGRTQHSSCGRAEPGPAGAAADRAALQLGKGARALLC